MYLPELPRTRRGRGVETATGARSSVAPDRDRRCGWLRDVLELRGDVSLAPPTGAAAPLCDVPDLRGVVAAGRLLGVRGGDGPPAPEDQRLRRDVARYRAARALVGRGRGRDRQARRGRAHAAGRAVPRAQAVAGERHEARPLTRRSAVRRSRRPGCRQCSRGPGLVVGAGRADRARSAAIRDATRMPASAATSRRGATVRRDTPSQTATANPARPAAASRPTATSSAPSMRGTAPRSCRCRRGQKTVAELDPRADRRGQQVAPEEDTGAAASNAFVRHALSSASVVRCVRLILIDWPCQSRVSSFTLRTCASDDEPSPTFAASYER